MHEIIENLHKYTQQILKYWNMIWGIIGAAALIIGLLVGMTELHDRFFPVAPQEKPEQVREYIFGNQYYYVQALVNEANKVVAYGITTRSPSFNPTFTILENAYSADPNDPSNLDKATPWLKKITLGITTFSDLNDTPENIVAVLGARRFYYHEEYYYGNPGNYQSYFFALNDSGDMKTDEPDLSFFNESNIDISNPVVREFRKESAINTIYITAPMVGLVNSAMRKYSVGPDYDQMRVIPDSTIHSSESIENEIKRLHQLSTEVDISKIIGILGQPIVVNNEPALTFRNDSPPYPK